uniref:PlsC domain-containing protein n=1 Tax=Rhabditophanes sp. KR3021 TaxID=114890 RepID=A0AC35TS54_9BILA
MILTILPIIRDIRPYVPATLLTASMVPFATASLGLHAAGLVLPRRWVEYIDNKMFSSYLKMCLFVFENVSGVEIHVYGDYDDIIKRDESAIVFSNHQTSADWIISNCVAARKQTEFGLRFVVKSSLQYIPLFAWYIYQRGFVFVRRFGDFVFNPVERQFNYLKALNSSFWLGIYPEGTRFDATNLKAIDTTHDWCYQKGVKTFMNVGRPHSKGFSLAFTHLEANIGAVYDFTIGYNNTNDLPKRGKVPDMFELCVSAAKKKEIHIHMKRHPKETVPQTTAGHQLFLLKSFEEKEELFDNFYTKGTFALKEEKAVVLETIPFSETLPSVAVFVGLLLAPLFSSKVRTVYLATICVSPVLIVWTRRIRNI